MRHVRATRPTPDRFPWAQRPAARIHDEAGPATAGAAEATAERSAPLTVVDSRPIECAHAHRVYRHAADMGGVDGLNVARDTGSVPHATPDRSDVYADVFSLAY